MGRRVFAIVAIQRRLLTWAVIWSEGSVGFEYSDKSSDY